MTAQLTVAQPLASALTHGLASLIVVEKPPVAWCPTCKGSAAFCPGGGKVAVSPEGRSVAALGTCNVCGSIERLIGPDGLLNHHWQPGALRSCPVCDSSLGVKAGDRLTVTSGSEPPHVGDRVEYGDWLLGPQSSWRDWALVHRSEQRGISLPLDTVVGSVVVDNCYPVVAWDSSDGYPVGYPDDGPVIQYEDAHDDLDPSLTVWLYGDGECPDADLPDELLWQSFRPGQWALLVSDPQVSNG